MVTLEDLLRVPIFQTAPDEILLEIAGAAVQATYAPGEVVLPFGQPFTFFGVVLSGEVAAYVGTEDFGDELRAIERIKAGGQMGPMSIMTGLTNPVDLIATVPTQVLLVPVELFRRWIQADPTALQKFAKQIAKRSTLIEKEQQESARRRAETQTDPYGLSLAPGASGPQKVLVLNLRSGSLKYRYFDTADETKNLEGQVEWIDQPGTLLTHVKAGTAQRFELSQADHKQALEAVLDRLVDPKAGVIRQVSEITAVGHRVVHGSEKYQSPVIIDEQVLHDIHCYAPLAPLHNPIQARGIEIMRQLLPDVPHVAVFDTAFHQTMPDYAFRYALPEELYEKDRIRRYGFHGLSHQYVGLMAATHLKKRFSRLKIITLHLGEGASACAIDHGRSMDTTMGLTPLEGLMMVTRSGDIDPEIVLHLMRKGMSADEIENLLNRESGLKGLSGLSGDTREIAAAANEGDAKALLSVEVFAYRIRKAIGAYYAALGGLDVLVFTGGIGENAHGVRAMACQGLWGLGILIDAVKNRSVTDRVDGVVDISHPNSKVKVLVVHSDASRMIAREAIRVLSYEAITKQMQATQMPIPLGVSAHHVHLSQADVERLFGAGHQLTPHSPLSQPDQYAAKEQVKLTGPKGVIDRVRVLGPARSTTQVEISRTEGYRLGINAPIRMSGDLDGTPGLQIEGPAGTIDIKHGVIYAQRHIHMSVDDADRFGLRDGDVLSIRAGGEREVIFGDTVVRVSPKFALEFHLDTDEANAAQLNSGDAVFIDTIQRRGNRE
jgi:acetate kinase